MVGSARRTIEGLHQVSIEPFWTQRRYLYGFRQKKWRALLKNSTLANLAAYLER